MRKFLAFGLVFLTILSCKDGSTNGENSGSEKDLVDLQNEVQQLKLENELKDSVINESLAFFNEITSNLEAIGIRKDEIRTLSNDPEISGDDKDWILEEIRHINFLREENANNLGRMQAQMKKSGLNIKELEVMIESLMKDIQWKDEQINLLQKELSNLDREYSALFDAYQDQAVKLDAIRDEMNSVYYAYGSEKELVENGVMERKNGFMGVGKKVSLKDDFNAKYFTRLNAAEKKNITIEGADIRFVTYHPKSSYELLVEGARTRIQILDASEFWKLSKYLVVIVE